MVPTGSWSGQAPERRRRCPTRGRERGPVSMLHQSMATESRSLLIQTAFLGDVVLTIPLLQALADRHGPAYGLTTPGAAALIETHPAVRRVVRWDKKSPKSEVRSPWRLGRALAREGYARVY